MKLQHELRREYFNKNTGHTELTTEQKSFAKKATIQEFFMWYIDTVKIKSYHKLSSSSKSVLVELMIRLQYDKGCVSLTRAIRDEICNAIDIKYQTLSNCLAELKKKGLIVNYKGDIYVSEELAWKGSNDIRENFIKNGGVLNYFINIGIAKEEIDLENKTKITTVNPDDISKTSYRDFEEEFNQLKNRIENEKNK